MEDARKAFTDAAVERSKRVSEKQRVPEYGAFIFEAFNKEKTSLGFVIGPQFEGPTPGGLSGNGSAPSVSVTVDLTTPAKFEITPERAQEIGFKDPGARYNREVAFFGVAEHIHTHPANLRWDPEPKNAREYVNTRGKDGSLSFSAADYRTYEKIWSDRGANRQINFTVVSITANGGPPVNAAVTTSLPQNRSRLDSMAPEVYMQTKGVKY